jgi:hypothetical protein
MKNEYTDTDIKILKQVIKDYNILKLELDDKINNEGYTFEDVESYIRHLSSCDITNSDEYCVDFNYCDMALSIYGDYGVYLGDEIEVWNDKDLYEIGIFNNIEEIEKIVSEYEIKRTERKNTNI